MEWLKKICIFAAKKNNQTNTTIMRTRIITMFAALCMAMNMVAQSAEEIREKDAKDLEILENYLRGCRYYSGEGVTKDYQKAAYYFEKAANKGDAAAQAGLGYMYYGGTGVTKDYQKAVYWLKKAANQGCAPAQHSLSIIYKDPQKAAYWKKKYEENPNK